MNRNSSKISNPHSNSCRLNVRQIRFKAPAYPPTHQHTPDILKQIIWIVFVNIYQE